MTYPSARSSARPSSPTTNNPDLETHDLSPYVQGNDNAKRQAISNTALTHKAVHRRTDAMVRFF